jgi:hypothetical protein
MNKISQLSELIDELSRDCVFGRCSTIHSQIASLFENVLSIIEDQDYEIKRLNERLDDLKHSSSHEVRMV